MLGGNKAGIRFGKRSNEAIFVKKFCFGEFRFGEAPSSNGLGHHSFTVEIRVRFPVGSQDNTHLKIISLTFL